MKKWTAICFLFFLAFNQIHAQGIDFYKGKWAEALAQAQEEGKVIFVDAYASWCGPCKRMARTAFPDPKVGEFYNKNFISVKIDMEKGEGPMFRQTYPVQSFPTLYYIDAKGEVLFRAVGARSAEQLVQMGEMVLRKIDYSADYQVEYEKGNRDPEFMIKYVTSLNKSGKESLKIANDYLKTQKDLTTPENLKFIFAAATEADSRIFDLLVQHRSAIEKLTSKEEVAAKIESACACTAAKALEYEVEELHLEAKKKMEKHCPKQAAAFTASADMKYYRQTNDAAAYLKACNTYVKKSVKKDAKKLNEVAMQMMDGFSDDPKVMKQAEKYAKKATEQEEQAMHYLTYATILYKRDKMGEAKKLLKRH